MDFYCGMSMTKQREGRSDRMHFFLQGEPQVGKSYLLQSELKNRSLSVTGYTPQRLYLNGDVVAYRAEMIQDNKPSIPLDGLYDPSLSNILIDRTRKMRDITVPERLIKEVRHRLMNETYDVVMLDEIGGFEMDSEEFVATILPILEVQSCIGVIKHPSRAMIQTKKSQAGRNYQLLVDKILERGCIFTMERSITTILKMKLDDYLNEVGK